MEIGKNNGLNLCMTIGIPTKNKISHYSIERYKMPYTPRKYAKKAYKKVYGSRKFSGAVKKTAEVAKDVAGLTASVAMIMGRLNVEKNYVDTDVATSSVGQVNANSDGSYKVDITPSISQGDGQGNRHGNSLKMTGISLPFQISGKSNCTGARKLRVSLLKVKSADNGISATEAFEHYWDTNPLTGVRDFNAPRNYRSGAHDGITCVRSQTYFLPAPSLLSGSAVDAEKAVLTRKFNVKLNDVFRYDVNGDTKPTGLRYILVIQADAGNSGSSSTLDVPIQDSNTVMDLRVSQRSWYVDN